MLSGTITPLLNAPKRGLVHARKVGQLLKTQLFLRTVSSDHFTQKHVVAGLQHFLIDARIIFGIYLAREKAVNERTG